MFLLRTKNLNPNTKFSCRNKIVRSSSRKVVHRGQKYASLLVPRQIGISCKVNQVKCIQVHQCLVVHEKEQLSFLYRWALVKIINTHRQWEHGEQDQYTCLKQFEFNSDLHDEETLVTGYRFLWLWLRSMKWGTCVRMTVRSYMTKRVTNLARRQWGNFNLEWDFTRTETQMSFWCGVKLDSSTSLVQKQRFVHQNPYFTPIRMRHINKLHPTKDFFHSSHRELRTLHPLYKMHIFSDQQYLTICIYFPTNSN